MEYPSHAASASGSGITIVKHRSSSVSSPWTSSSMPSCWTRIRYNMAGSGFTADIVLIWY